MFSTLMGLFNQHEQISAPVFRHLWAPAGCSAMMTGAGGGHVKSLTHLLVMELWPTAVIPTSKGSSELLMRETRSGFPPLCLTKHQETDSCNLDRLMALICDQL
ncbi:hypothetical protein AAFF_G00430550 [Aldrovandia affinis]|uniref:Uncharacterized protein n=1 Tax=Aldrovandia affinis TaxID=143900 RepID=A0AAD7SBD2_9TELE|nr:hypothetical protein AAFF_G00430550 [Aldrovandia affinis]